MTILEIYRQAESNDSPTAMSITPQQLRKLHGLIKGHVEAQIDLSWKGSTDPECWDDIEKAAKQAHKKLLGYLAGITVVKARD